LRDPHGDSELEMTLLLYLLAKSFIAVFFAAIGRGLVSYFELDLLVAKILHATANSRKITGIAWIVAGLIGLLGASAWEVFHVDARLRLALNLSGVSRPRHLQQDEQKRLVDVFKPLADSFLLIVIYADDDPDKNAIHYATDFAFVFGQLNIQTTGVAPVQAAIGQTGIMVGMIDADQPSERAVKFRDALQRAGFDVKPTKWVIPPGMSTPGGVDFNLFIGPEGPR
jgi:hypothetical protein